MLFIGPQEVSDETQALTAQETGGAQVAVAGSGSGPGAGSIDLMQDGISELVERIVDECMPTDLRPSQTAVVEEKTGRRGYVVEEKRGRDG